VASREVTITHAEGLHARPAAIFCRAAARFEADVRVEKDGAGANAKSLLSVLQLDVRRGDLVTLRAAGSDAEEAVHELAEVLARP
jgi:phosphotransferase system HPr (HPr) family protein